MTSFKLIDTTSTDIKEGKTLCTAKQQRFATRHFLSDTIIQNFPLTELNKKSRTCPKC